MPQHINSGVPVPVPGRTSTLSSWPQTFTVRVADINEH
jgi:hypothetical protein